MERANKACRYISDYAYERLRLRATTPTSDYAYESGTRSKQTLQEAVHHEVRERLDLAAQMAIRAHAQVADAHRANPDAHNPFDVRGGFPYDSRVLRFYTDRQEVSV